jgi:hypothetical protein
MKASTFGALLCASLAASLPSALHAAEQPESLWPNKGGKTIMTPSGWGASNGMVFFGVGRTTPQVYSTVDDMGAAAGIGIGNPEKNIGVQLSATMNDVSEQNNFSYGIKLHRIIADGTSIAVGGEHLFHDDAETDPDADESFYVSVSHALQSMPSSYNADRSKLHLTLGVGNGRFGDKSQMDIATGKGEQGTYVFGAAAYEVYKATNVILEWSGINLHAGLSTGIFSLAENFPVNVTVAAGDLTDYSGDEIRLLSSLSCAFIF